MQNIPTILVTGGAGFIGSNFVLSVIRAKAFNVVNVDKLTYAGNLDNLSELGTDSAHVFVRGDIGDRALVSKLLDEHRPVGVVNFAAESHVDRSIDAPGDFIRTNVVGTFELLEATRAHLAKLAPAEAGRFRFLHVSTDEVYGSLGPTGHFTEESRYSPNSPYSASKAAADHLVRAYHETYGVPAITTNCSNNYGPFQFPEKLVPLMILNALERKALPIYGDGRNVRDWLYVEDHCDAIRLALEKGVPGETYNIGGRSEQSNLDVVHTLCDLLDEALGKTHRELMKFVADRPGHDRRYAIDPTKAERELGWKAAHTFETGIRRTVKWYLEHRAWCARISSGVYRGERLGLADSTVTGRSA